MSERANAQAGKRRRVTRAAIGMAVLGLGGAAAFAITRAPSGVTGSASPSVVTTATAAAPRSEAGDAELALVSPLSAGAALAGYTVARIDAVRDGTLRLVCKDGKATVRLDVALASDNGPPPPARTDRFAVYYVARGAPPVDSERLALALAKILEANAKVPTPPGLAVFTPAANDGLEL